jgi:hypothetical protein
MQAPYKAQIERMLVQYVLPTFDAPAGYLRAKACWVTQQYADIKFAEGRGRGATFVQLFQKTLALLGDPDLPVRCHPLSFHSDFGVSVKSHSAGIEFHQTRVGLCITYVKALVV